MSLPLKKINPRLVSGFASKETKDCSVRALANALNVPYESAHHFLKYYTKRKNGRGVGMLALYHLFNNKKDVFAKNFNVTIWEEKRFSTINQLIKNKPKGRFYVLVREHATAVVDGNILDMGCKNWHIKYCWQVIPKSA